MTDRRFFQTSLGKAAAVSVAAMSVFVLVTLPIQLTPDQHAAPVHTLPGQVVLATMELA
ncbi:MAG: hypothetical protein WA954_11020 [Parerythrobacter sp.]